jgi:Holliday junction resolvasome RuvABC endonuclease subunit
MQTILALDPSLTNTAVIRGNAHGYELQTFSSKNIGDDVAARVQRLDDFVDRIMVWIGETEVSAIYIEAYSYGSNDARAKFSAEYGGILRWHLVELTERIFEVAPATLKKFCTGKGAGGKDLVAAHLAKRHGVMFPDNDSFDAFGLFRLGLVAEGLVEPDNQAQREAADRVLGITAPKPKKKRQAAVPEVF